MSVLLRSNENSAQFREEEVNLPSGERHVGGYLGGVVWRVCLLFDNIGVAVALNGSVCWSMFVYECSWRKRRLYVNKLCCSASRALRSYDVIAFAEPIL